MKTAYAIHRPVENSYLVRQRDRRIAKELVRVVGIVLALGSVLLAYTWLHVETLRAGYRIEGLERRLEALNERERQLRLEAAYREHPEQIGQRARKELGMSEPNLGQMLFFQELGR